MIKHKNNLEKVRPAMSKDTHTRAHTQANEVTDPQKHTGMKTDNFLHKSTAGQQRGLRSHHLCAITNLLGEWNGEFSAPFKTKPGIE